MVGVFDGVVTGLMTRYIASDGQKWTASMYIDGLECVDGSGFSKNDCWQGQPVQNITIAAPAPSKVVEGK
jgi:hypothetical protein